MVVIRLGIEVALFHARAAIISTDIVGSWQAGELSSDDPKKNIRPGELLYSSCCNLSGIPDILRSS